MNPTDPASARAFDREGAHETEADGPRSWLLDGRIAIVFGGGANGPGVSNGEAAARCFSSAGASVVVVDIDGDAATVVADKIVAGGGAACGVGADVRNERQVEAAYARARAEFGVPDILHNNVGVAQLGSVVELDIADWNATFETNVTSMYLTARLAIPGMLSLGRGAIVNVSSLASIRDTGYVYPAYSASKGAVNQLTVSLAHAYAARGIRANAVLPGLIDTPMVRQQITDDAGAIAFRHAASPTGRMGSPWDVGNAATFLASDAARYINGICLPVDGGLSSRCF